MNDQMRTWLTRGGIALGVFLFGGLVGWMAHGHAQGQRISFYKDWRVACPADDDKKSSCALASDIVEPKSGTKLATLTWGVEANKPDVHVIVLNVPLTVLVQPGIGLQIGTDTKTYQYATCLPGGCVATIPVDDKLVESMKSASTMGVVVTAESGRSFTLPISTEGYKDAYEAMASTDAKRNSWLKRLF